jgi:methionyl-tRNA formyltransferase
MKILFLGGNLAKSLSDWLDQQGEDVLYKEDKITVNEVKQISPEIIVSYNYKYIIPKQILECVNGNAINLHISYLPYNRGCYPNVWSFIEDTPKGVTIHYIDEGIDTGDIIIRKEVFIDEDKETLKSSYEILHREIQALFKENWNKIKNSEINTITQVGGCTTREKVLNSSLLLKKRDGIPSSESLKSNIIEGRISLRDVEAYDINDLFDWRNHSDVRKNSFNSDLISWDEHEKWFKAKIKDSHTSIYIACSGKDKVGSIRFEDKGDVIKGSIMLNPDFLGKGLGSEVIRLGTERFIKEKNPEKPVYAEIKIDNIASIKAFQKAGYKEQYLTFLYSKDE